MHIQARHYATGEPVEITCAHGKIESVLPSPRLSGPPSPWVAPALFDLQINGCDGHSFNSEWLTPDTIRHVVGVCRRHGIGAFCPTLVTNAFAALAHGLTTLRKVCEVDTDLAAAMPAIH